MGEHENSPETHKKRTRRYFLTHVTLPTGIAALIAACTPNAPYSTQNAHTDTGPTPPPTYPNTAETQPSPELTQVEKELLIEWKDVIIVGNSALAKYPYCPYHDQIVRPLTNLLNDKKDGSGWVQTLLLSPQWGIKETANRGLQVTEKIETIITDNVLDPVIAKKTLKHIADWNPLLVLALPAQVTFDETGENVGASSTSIVLLPETTLAPNIYPINLHEVQHGLDYLYTIPPYISRSKMAAYIAECITQFGILADWAMNLSEEELLTCRAGKPLVAHPDSAFEVTTNRESLIADWHHTLYTGLQKYKMIQANGTLAQKDFLRNDETGSHVQRFLVEIWHILTGPLVVTLDWADPNARLPETADEIPQGKIAETMRAMDEFRKRNLT